MKKLAVGYVRVSTVSQAQDGESLNTQKSQIKDFCKKRDWKLLEFYEDAGVSGVKANRPGLDSLFEAAERHEFEAVVAADLTRFGRSAKDLLTSTQKLKELGISFHTDKGNIDTNEDSPFGKLTFTILSAMSEFERELIMIRTKENKMVRWSKREIYNGKTPYGYRWNKHLKCMEEHPDESRYFKRIVTEYLDHGKSLKSISIGLNGDGIPTRIRGRWSSGTISTILHSEAYCGMHTVNRYKLDGEGNIVGSKPLEEHITYEFPPLITHERWQELQKRLEDSKVERTGRPSSLQKAFLLYGLLRCGNCYDPKNKQYGRIAPLYGRYRNDGSRARFYGCYWNQTGEKALKEANRHRCTLKKIPADYIEAYIWRILTFILFGMTEKNYDKIFKTAHWAEKEEKAIQKIKSVKTDLKKVANTLRNLKGLLELDNVDLRAYAADKAEAERRQIELNQRLKEANNELEDAQRMRQEKENFLTFAHDKKKLLRQVERIVNSLPMEKKQRLLAGMLRGVIQIGPIENYDLILEDAPIEQWDDGTAPTYRSSWLDRIYFEWRPNVEILKEILGPYLGPDGDNGGGSGGNGAENCCEGLGISCKVERKEKERSGRA